MSDRQPTVLELLGDQSLVVIVSDKGVIVSLSKEVMESCGKTVRTYIMRILPWILTVGLTALGGTAGIRALLQQDTPAISPTEEVIPQQ